MFSTWESPFVMETPGASSANRSTLCEDDGSSVTIFVLALELICVVNLSTRDTAAETSTVSATAPTFRAISVRVALFTSTATAEAWLDRSRSPSLSALSGREGPG
jgi:hypothetical protein